MYASMRFRTQWICINMVTSSVLVKLIRTTTSRVLGTTQSQLQVQYLLNLTIHNIVCTRNYPITTTGLVPIKLPQIQLSLLKQTCSLHSPTYSRNSSLILVRFWNSMWILVGFWLDSGILGGFWVNSGWIPELYLQVQVHFLSVLYQ